MGAVELFILAVGLSMDAFAVSVCKGLSMQRADFKGMVVCGIWFGSFQALMPFIGFWLGSLFASAIVSFDHWIAFGLLALIGGNMLKEAFSHEEECCCNNSADLSFWAMLTLAVATSIDALAAGISMAMTGDINIVVAVALIGLTTFVLSAAGVKMGSIFGNRFEQKAEIAGGIILILLGAKILCEHVGVF